MNGTRIFFDVDGASHVPDGPAMRERPVLFLLHGGPGGDHASFKKQLAPLTDVAQLVYVDHRGSGRSAPCDPASCTLENNVADVEGLRQHLGLERIALLGASYGGMVAQGYAIEHGAHLSKLVLSCTAPSFRFLDDAKRIVRERGTEAQQRACERLWEGAFESDEQVKDFFFEMGGMYSRAFDPEEFEATWGLGIWNRAQLNLGFSTFLRTFDFTPDLARIGCETLVLAGAHDWICPPDQSGILAREIPNARLEVFAESAHRVGADEPEAYLGAIRGFLTDAPARPSQATARADIPPSP